jgi:gluconolactonase
MRVIAEGLQFPEGPIALPDGSFLVVEIRRGTLTHIEPDGRCRIVADLGGGPNGAAIGPDGHCYVCNNGGLDWTSDGGITRPFRQATGYSGGRIERVDIDTGQVEILYTESEDGPLKGPNDLVFDGDGGFWFTDTGKVRDRDMDRGAVYYAKADGSGISRVLFPVLTANGIGLSPDDRVLYVVEGLLSRLWAFEVTAPGEVRKLPWPSPHGGRLVTAMSDFRLMDSLAVDSSGNICIGTVFTSGVTVVDPTGSIISFVEMVDDLYTTNVCFGGEGLRKAYLTLSTTGRLVEIDWPVAGLPLHWLNRNLAPALLRRAQLH